MSSLDNNVFLRRLRQRSGALKVMGKGCMLLYMLCGILCVLAVARHEWSSAKAWIYDFLSCRFGNFRNY